MPYPGGRQSSEGPLCHRRTVEGRAGSKGPAPLCGVEVFCPDLLGDPRQSPSGGEGRAGDRRKHCSG